MDIIKCPNCNSEISVNDKYCTNCGFDVETFLKNSITETEKNESEDNSKRTKKYIIIGAVLSILVIIICVCLFTPQSKLKRMSREILNAYTTNYYIDINKKNEGVLCINKPKLICASYLDIAYTGTPILFYEYYANTTDGPYLITVTLNGNSVIINPFNGKLSINYDNVFDAVECNETSYDDFSIAAPEVIWLNKNYGRKLLDGMSAKQALRMFKNRY